MAKYYRVKCACGNVMNACPGNVCTRCKQPLVFPEDGMISLYRKGNFFGCAGGFGLYINGEPFGHIGNRETLHIPVAYGKYNLHVAVGISRKCTDLIINVTPENPRAYAKVSIKPGFFTNSFVIVPATPEEMPET